MIDPKTFELTFKFTVEETNILLVALQELPAKVCNPMSQKIQMQAQPQLPQPEQPQGELADKVLN
jgi:hypothetical protein